MPGYDRLRPEVAGEEGAGVCSQNAFFDKTYDYGLYADII